jgi:hypothetical protein
MKLLEWMIFACLIAFAMLVAVVRHLTRAEVYLGEIALKRICFNSPFIKTVSQPER